MGNAPPETGGASGPRVLIIEDDEVGSDLLARWLRLRRDCTETAASVRGGLDRIRSTWPDAVIVDFHLPDGDGFDFLRRLRAVAPPRDTAALIFSADWEIEDCRDEAHALGAAILSKIVDLADVERMIASLSTGKALH